MKIDKVCLYSYTCILLFYEFLMYFIVFKFLCILLFYDICCLRSSFGSISSWINDTKQKEDKNTDLQAKIKNSLCHLFCILTFWVDLWSQKVTWLRNGRSDFRKLGVKISARLQRKSGTVVLRVRQNLSSAVRVNA